MKILALVVAFALAASSCRSAYYGTMEAFGVHKRDILVERVKEGRATQEEAKEEFESALESFKKVVKFHGGDLERLYYELKDGYESCSGKATEVKERIESIEAVSDDLFDEWSSEIKGMQDPDLKRKSQRLLSDTRDRYEDVVGAMKAAEKKMKPVLAAFHDHVTFLKHDLNAQAIAALQGELDDVEDDVAALIREMEKSIAKIDEFLERTEKAGAKP